MDLVSERLAELIAAPDELGADEPVLLGCVRLAARPESVGEARRITVGVLKQLWIGEELRHSAELIVSELVTNAVVHVVGDDDPHVLLVVMQSGRTLKLKVYDAGSNLVLGSRPGHGGPRPEPGSDAESGRGLVIVDALADRWGATSSAFGKCLWAELDVGEVMPGGLEA